MTSPASTTLLSRRDLDFLLFDWLRVDDLLDRPRFREHSRETVAAMLDLSASVAAEHFAPHSKKSDSNEPTFDGTRVHLIPEIKQALAVFAETGLLGSSMDYDVGGMQAPTVVTSACLAWFQAANISTTAYPFLTMANANLLRAHGTDQQIHDYVLPMVQGRFYGTMCLSEPGAGSSLADIMTQARPQPDGTYRLFGNKMWISGGEHELSENIVHLVLAKIPGGPPGVKGISLFIVPKYLLGTGERNDVVLAGLNHKMGYRGTTNTLLNFGEGVHRPGGDAGAVGFLVGEPHRGLSYMFHMMNEARIGVGMGAASLGYTGYLQSLAYARTRLQGRLRSGGDTGGPQVRIIEHPDVRRMLLAQKSYAEGALALALYCAKLVDEAQTTQNPDERRRTELLLEVLTPIAKSWPSQWCLYGNSLAIQVLGGYGYSREYNVEQLYRDNRLNAIHEGTHGIQGLDLLGRKVGLDGGEGLRLLCETILTTAGRAELAGGELAEFGAQLRHSCARLVEVTAIVRGESDRTVGLANSSYYLEAVGHVVIAWIWAEQALAAADRPGEFHDGKRHTARYFFRHELPISEPRFALLASLDRTTVDMSETWF